MGSFNSIIVSERNQRPSFEGKTILRAYFMRDGQYVPLDNTQVSSVMLFKKVANTSPSSILDSSTGLVSETAASEAVWRWTLSGWEGWVEPYTWAPPNFLSESEYTPVVDTASTSSIFQTGAGKLAVILDGSIDGSCLLRDSGNNYNGVEGRQLVGAASALSGEPAATYIDVWTVKLCAGCEWQTFINDTQFFQNNAVILTEPLLFSTREVLYNKRIEVGSIEKLKIGTEITIENKNIDPSIKNILNDGLITDGEVQIIRHNDVNKSQPAWTTIKTFLQTTGLVEITGDNTFLYTFETTNESPGTYSVQVRYNVLDETRLSPLMYFTVV